MAEPRKMKLAGIEGRMDNAMNDDDGRLDSGSSESSDEFDCSDDPRERGGYWPDVRVIGNRGYAKCRRCGKLVCVNKLLLGSLHFCKR